MLWLPVFLFDLSRLQSELDGKWAQPCQLGGERSETFNGDTVALTESSSQNADCSDPDTSLVSAGTYRLGHEFFPGDEIFERPTMDFSFSTVTLTLYHDDQAGLYNQDKVCGFDDWKAGEGKDITGLQCDLWMTGKPTQIPRAGLMRYGIYRVDSKASPQALYFGQLSLDRQGATPDLRPLTFDPQPYLKASQ
jgi:hypothetical protein